MYYQEEANGKTRKLKKVWSMLQSAKSELTDLQVSFKGTLHFRNNLGLKDSLRYSTPIMRKIPQTFLAKILKVTFRAVLALWCINAKIS